MMHPAKLSKTQAKVMTNILKDSQGLLRCALRDVVEREDVDGKVHFMAGVATGIMITLQWLEQQP